MMELADMRDLGSRVAGRAGSTPVTRTMASVLTAFEVLLRTLAFLYSELTWDVMPFLVFTDTYGAGSGNTARMKIAPTQ